MCSSSFCLRFVCCTRTEATFVVDHCFRVSDRTQLHDSSCRVKIKQKGVAFSLCFQNFAFLSEFAFAFLVARCKNAQSKLRVTANNVGLASFINLVSSKFLGWKCMQSLENKMYRILFVSSSEYCHPGKPNHLGISFHPCSNRNSIQSICVCFSSLFNRLHQ